jgi:hypothetical protein
MTRKFTITTPAETVRIGANGRGEMVFTVTNTAGAPERALVRPSALGTTRAEWLSVAGESEREFGPGATQQFTIAANIPPGTPAGRYTWRLDVISARRGGEEREEGPTVAFEVAASEAPKKKSLWWLWLALALLLVIVAVVVALSMRKDDEPPVVETVDRKAEVPRNGVVLWLIADDARPSGGASVDFWQNAEFPGPRASALNIPAQPTVVPNVLNGHSVLRFDGVDDMLRTNVEFGRGRMPAATVFTVFNSATDAAAPLRKLYGGDDGGFDPAAGLDSRSGGHNYTVFTGSGVAPYFALQRGRTYLTADRYLWTSFSGWVDGRQALNGIPTNHDTQTLPQLYLGGIGPIFREPWNGDIAEVIVYARALDDAERHKVEDYLADKYRIALSR